MRKKNLMTRVISLAMAAMMVAPSTALAATVDEKPDSVIETDVAAEGKEAADTDEKVITEEEKSAEKEDAEVTDTSDTEEKKEPQQEAVTMSAELTAPKVKDVKLEGGFMGKYYRVYFASDASAYLKAAGSNASVTINGQQVKYVPSFFGDTNSYKFSTDSAYGGDNIYIDFTEDCFKTGTAAVKVAVTGYSDLQFTMKDGKISTEEPSEPAPEETKKTAPEVNKLTCVEEFSKSTYQLSFKGNNISTFLSAITNITVNGNELKKVISFWNDKLSYKLSNDPAYGGDNIYIDFTEDCFPKTGSVSVEIKAKGYEPLTFNVKDGEISAEEEAKFATLVKTVDLGWSEYIVADLEDGFNLENVKFAVDGKDIQPTKVTDDGNIVKWEVSSLDHKELTITQDKKIQRIDLGGKGAAEEVKTGKTAPDYFMLNGPVYVWDYHLTNYDDNGNVRVVPAKTTFDLNAKAGGVKYYSPDAELIPDESSHFGVKGTVEVMFNYEKGTDTDKAFVDGITDVDLVAYNENKNTINSELEFTLDKAFPHNGNTVACIKIPLGQTNFYSAGRYYVRVKSNGKGHLFPIHVVNSVVPSMILTDDNVVAGQQDIHFKVKDMTYAITMPIYKVELTDPEGNVKELEKINDWYLIGDLFVLYNHEGDGNYLAKAGNYKLDIFADGFKPFSKTFAVSEGTNLITEGAMTLDAVSSASLNGGGSGGSGEGGMDTNVMNANLVINADLLINAKILSDMSIINGYASGIAERWDSMNKIAVYMKGAEKVYDAGAYFDAVNTAKTKNKYLSFADYVAGGNAVTTKNRPFAVKQVLEDNLLGDVTNFNESSANQAPDMILTATTETSATFTTTDKNYLKALESKGELLLNSDGKVLGKENYTINSEKGTLEVRNTKVGENKLTLRVPGYQTFKLVFECSKELQEVALKAEGSYVGENVTVECTAHSGKDCDYMKQIQTLLLTAPDGQQRTILPEGQESEGVGYTINKNVLTIGGKVFTESWAQNADKSAQAGKYTIQINARYYPAKTVEVTLNVKADPSELLQGPTVKNITFEDAMLGKFYRVSFNEEETAVAKFIDAINNITVNGKKVDRVTSFFNTTNGYKPAADPAYGGSNIYVEFSKDCFEGKAEVVISAKGYKDLKFNVKDGVLSNGDEVKPDGSETVRPDKSKLEETIKANESAYKEANYTEETWGPYANALVAAKAVLAKEDATQEEIDLAVKSLSDASKGLKENTTPEPETPEPENPQPENPQPENPQPENPQPENPQPEKPETVKPDSNKPEINKPETDKPEVNKPETAKPNGNNTPVVNGNKPASNAQGVKPAAKPAAPGTGDETNVFAVLAVMMCAAGTAVTVRKKIRK